MNAIKPREWRSRIVGHDEVDPTELMANPLNWRIHPTHQRAAVMEALQEVGWVQEVVVNKTTGNLVDGHLRVDLAVERGEPLVPVQYVELTEDEEKLVLATLDPLAALAVADSANLALILEGTEVQGAVLRGFLDDLDQTHGDLPPLNSEPSGSKDFWPRISVAVAPDVFDRWRSGMEDQDEQADSDAVDKLLQKAGY